MAELLAPMPGTILKLECAVGETVAADQLVMVMEAMKMEVELFAPAAGVVTEIPVAAGEPAAKGAVLLRIQD